MGGLSGSKYVKFGKLFRAPWEFAKNGIFNSAYEDPTYLTFKVEFGGWGRSQKELVNANVYVDDAEYNNVWDANFDDYPMGLFDMNFQLPNDADDSYYSKTDTYGTVSRYNAVNWLYTRHEDMRAEYLKTFIEGLTSLQTFSPHFITSVTGVDSLIDWSADRGMRIKNDAKLTFSFNDSIDQRVRTLFELYRKAAWDDEYQRWVLPENLREFKMILYISEIRDFHRPRKNSIGNTNTDNNLLNSDKNVVVDKVSDLINKWVFTNGQDAVEYGGNNIAPVYAFECSPCQFEIGPLFSSEYKSSTEGNDEQIKVSVKVKNVRTYMKNSVIDKIDNFIISDQISVYKRFYGSNGTDYSTNIDAPYNSWLRRDFFTNLYANAGGDASSFVTTYGTTGTISDLDLLSAYNNEIFSMSSTLDGAASLGGLLSANVKRLLGATPSEILGNKFSFSEYVEDYLLDALYTNLKKIAILDDGIFLDKFVSQQLMSDMMGNWRTALSNMKMHDEDYLNSIDKGIDLLMGKLKTDQDLLENIYSAGVETVNRLSEQKNKVMNGAKPEGVDPNLDFVETTLVDTDSSVEFQDMPLEDTSIDLQFNKVELDKTSPSLQFNNIDLDDPSINLEFQDTSLEDTAVNLQFVDTQLDLTSPELIFNKVSLEDPGLELEFQSTSLEETPVNLEFNKAELEDTSVNLKFNKAELEETKNNVQFNKTELEETENSVKFNKTELEETPVNLKFNKAELEETKNNVQFNKTELEETENSAKFNKTELEDTSVNLKFNKAELEETENNVQFNKTELEETKNNVQFSKAELEETENNVQFNKAELEETENNVQFSKAELEETENNVQFNKAELEETKNNVQFNKTELEETENSAKFNKTELEETENNAQFNKVVLEQIDNKIQFKNVQLENLDNYISQLSQKIEELKNYKLSVEDDKEKGYGTKIKTLELLNSIIDTNIEAEKQLKSAKLILNDADSIDVHSTKMKDAKLEEPASKKTKLVHSILIDDYTPLTEIQPIDNALEFKEKYRRGYVREEPSGN